MLSNVFKIIRFGDHRILTSIMHRSVTKAQSPNLISTDSNNMNIRNAKFEVLPTPIKSASDKKEYKVIRLENGLTACLISDLSNYDSTCLFDENDISTSSSSSESETDEEEEDEESDESDDSEDSSDVESVMSDSRKTRKVPEQKMAAAALCVGVGSFSDPKDVQGMAHFLEHMVFMGSEKFPEENDFDSFLTKRGGSDNACTDCEITTFYFECLDRQLYRALDKFAQFFISPLMKRNSMEREREAIQSEYEMALPSNMYRKEHLLNTFAKKDSPVNTFTWGNRVTLKENISDDKLYEKVHEFRKRHYSAHRMTLAVQASFPLDALENYVLECFSGVPSNNLPPDDFSAYTNNVFDTPEFTRLYYVQPSTNICQLDLTWTLPSLFHKYKSKPHQYVSWILGHEGKGSLLSYLRKKVWALNMSTGTDESGNEFNSIYSLFTISITLTDEGLNHLDEVIETVFSYINMLKSIGPDKRIYDEIKTIEDISFRFTIEENAVDIVEDLCECMQIYPSEDYLTGSELYFEYDPDGIKMILDHLIPNKMNVMVMNNTPPDGLAFTKIDKWFSIKYIDINLPEEWLEKWANAKVLADFTLPEPNQFLTDNFDILPKSEAHHDYPRQILKNDRIELWYRKDEKFDLPIAYYYIYLINPLCLENPKNFAMMDMFVNLLLIQLIEEAYPAQIAELSYAFSTSDKGIILKMSGYNDKLPVLFELITTHLLTFAQNFTDDVFDAIKDKLIKLYYNELLSPNAIAKNVRLNIIVDKYYTIIEKYNAILDVSCDDFKTFSENFIRNLYIKTLVQGNISEDTTLNVIQKFVERINYEPLPSDSYPKFRVVEIPKGETICQVESFNKNDSNSIITNYYQSEKFNIKDSVIIEIIVLIIQEPLFDILRTKEQLGYNVYCSLKDTYGILGLTITVNTQATKYKTHFIDERIEEFVKHVDNLFAQMDVSAFEETKDDLIKTKRCPDVHLKEEVDRNWGEIIDDNYLFDRLEQEIKAIEQLQIDDIRNWWKTHNVCGDQSKFRKLSIQVVGFNIEDDCNEEQEDKKFEKTAVQIKFLEENNRKKTYNFIRDIDNFKKNLILHPIVFDKCA